MAMSKQAKVDRLWEIIEVNDLTIQTLCDLMEIDREEFFRLLRSKFLENYDVFDCLGDFGDDN
jgi:hypothetical protein